MEIHIDFVVVLGVLSIFLLIVYIAPDFPRWNYLIILLVLGIIGAAVSETHKKRKRRMRPGMGLPLGM